MGKHALTSRRDQCFHDIFPFATDLELFLVSKAAIAYTHTLRNETDLPHNAAAYCVPELYSFIQKAWGDKKRRNSRITHVPISFDIFIISLAGLIIYCHTLQATHLQFQVSLTMLNNA